MVSAGNALLIKSINKIPAFVIGKAQPLAVQLCPEAPELVKIVLYGKYKARRLAYIRGIFKPYGNDLRRLFP